MFFYLVSVPHRSPYHTSEHSGDLVSLQSEKIGVRYISGAGVDLGEGVGGAQTP